MMKDLNRSASNGKRFHRKTRSWDKRGGIDEEQKRVEKLGTKEEKLKQLEFQLVRVKNLLQCRSPTTPSSIL